MIHRTVLGAGPPQFQKWFYLDMSTPAYRTRLQVAKHNKQLYDWLGAGQTELLRRSLLGQVRVYNKLEQEVVNHKTTKAFQKALQNVLKYKAREEDDSWSKTFSERWR